jgi:hypothetical protein
VSRTSELEMVASAHDLGLPMAGGVQPHAMEAAAGSWAALGRYHRLRRGSAAEATDLGGQSAR